MPPLRRLAQGRVSRRLRPRKGEPSIRRNGGTAEKAGLGLMKILHCWMIYPFTDGVPVSGDSILHCHLQLPGGQRLLEKVEE